MHTIHNHRDLTVETLVKIREASGMSVPKFWEAAGVHRLTAYNYEKGRNAPPDSVMQIMYLARVVGLRLDAPHEQLVALGKIQESVAFAKGAIGFTVNHVREALDSLENSQQWLGAIEK